MSRIRANKITDKAGTGAIEIEKGAWFPVGYGLTGAGSVNITGVVTATSFSGSGAALTGIDATAIKDSGGAVKIQAQASGAVYTGIHTFGTNTNFTDIDVDGHTNLDNVNIAGVVTATTFKGAVEATSGTFSGSVSIGGTLTYEDVVNVDSVGLITARAGVSIPDSQVLNIGTGNDLQLSHDSNNSYIKDTGTGSLFITASALTIANPAVNENIAIFRPDDQVELFFNNTKRFTTSNTGAAIVGVCSATSFTGDGSALTGIEVGLSTEALTTAGATVTLDLTKDDHKITKSGTYTVTCTGGSEGSSHSLRIENSGTSSVSFSSYFKFPSGGTPSLPTTNGAISLISFTVHKAGSVGVNTVLLSGASVNYS
tara:strand:+ start:31 stop:1140 length:1110 start_codon:yes stop_codon:yes gene_type:complete